MKRIIARTWARLKKRIAVRCLDAGDLTAIQTGRRVLLTQQTGGMGCVELIKQIDSAHKLSAAERRAIVEHIVGESPLLAAHLVNLTAIRNGWAIIYACPSKRLARLVAEQASLNYLPSPMGRN